MWNGNALKKECTYLPVLGELYLIRRMYFGIAFNLKMKNCGIALKWKRMHCGHVLIWNSIGSRIAMNFNRMKCIKLEHEAIGNRTELE